MGRLRLTFTGMIRWCALIAAILSIVGLLQAFSRPAADRRCEATSEAEPCSSRGMRLPGLSLQLAEDTYEVGRIAHSRAARESLLANIRRDYFVIPVYVALFVALGLVLGRTSPTLGALVVACVLVAAVLDVAENIGSTVLLNTQVLTPPMVKAMLWVASSKWLLLFIVAGALSPLFLPGEGLLMKGVGLALASSALVGIYGLAFQRPLVEAGFLLLLGGIVLMGLALFLSPQSLHAEGTD